MRRILYIGKKYTKPSNGGEICSNNIQLILKEIFGSNYSIFSFTKLNKVDKILNSLLFCYPNVNIKEYRKLINYIYLLKPNYLFFESSHYGLLIKKLKQIFPTISIICFYQNIEYFYAKSYFKLWKPKTYYFYLYTSINEKLAAKFSDYNITINSNDSELLFNKYHIKSDFNLPFSVPNRVDQKTLKKLLDNNKLINLHNCLFIGSNFFGNTQGLDWFIHNVLPHVDLKLTIVGKGMSKKYKNACNIFVYDFVDDLSDFYKNTDFVLLPIISGGGMKTKTADALMWGKAIIGSRESFLGYNIKDCKGIYVCQTKNDYINAIQKIYHDNIYYFNIDIYNRFIAYHSIDITTNNFKKFLGV